MSTYAVARHDLYVFSSEILHQGVLLKESVDDQPTRPDAENLRSVIQPIFDAESALWICGDYDEPVPLLCDVGVQLTAPVAGIISYRLVASSCCSRCGVPGGRISAAVAEDVAWDRVGLSLDTPSVTFTVEIDGDSKTGASASRGCQFRGLPSVVTWLRPNGPCWPSPMRNSCGAEDASFSFGLQVRSELAVWIAALCRA